MNINNRLKEALKDLNLSITDAAKAAKIPYRSMQNYLRGEREPGAEALTSISEQLGISIDWLLTGQGTMYRDKTSTGVDLTPEQQALLTLFNDLAASDQREILHDAEKKKRLSELEQQVAELMTGAKK